MKRKKDACTVAVLGGDLRQMAAAKALCEDGCRVRVFALDTYTGGTEGLVIAGSIAEAAADADIVVLPLPVTKDGERLHCPLTKKTILLSELFDALPEGCRAVGGRVTDEVRVLAKKRRIRLTDYMEREELAVANAVPTAEGALALAMAEVPYTIHGARCLVLGYGRIGKVLARKLSALGARVTAAARKVSDLAWIEADGCTALPFSALYEDETELPFDLVFNTVPKEVLTGTVLQKLPKGVLILDLASAPGGVDRDFAKNAGYRVLWALSLPGKAAPVTAGRILRDSVLAILAEEDEKRREKMSAREEETRLPSVPAELTNAGIAAEADAQSEPSLIEDIPEGGKRRL